MKPMTSFCLLLATTSLWALPAQAVEPDRAFARRTATRAFAERCHLLSLEEMRALESGRLQARGALLRSGVSLSLVKEQERASANSVADIPCDEPHALAELNSLRNAFAVWAGLHKQEYKGDERSWIATRNASSRLRRWRVEQIIQQADNFMLAFGLTGLENHVSLDLVSEGGLPPRTIVLRMRDPQKMAKPLSPFLRKLLQVPEHGLASHAAPDSVSQTFISAGRVPAEKELLAAETDKTPGTRFSFGPDALAAFSTLDPREVAVLDLYWSNGLGKPDRVQRVYVEVGDFLAARLFAEKGMPQQVDDP